MFEKIKEGSIDFYAPIPEKISRDMPVFYNPVMKFNRDISVNLLNSLDRKKMRISLPLSGTGIRGIRFLKELKKGKLEKIMFNDHDKEAVKLIKKNLKFNKIKIDDSIQINCGDANEFMLENIGVDYIEIDPFGSPNPFLDNAMKRMSRNAILAITATDTAPLSGTYPKACRRKYWAQPLHNHEMHEVGIRILIRKVQLIGMQYDKALFPILSYFKDHYFRIFFLCEKGKKKCDEIYKKIDFYKEAGPLWTGNLFDKKLVKTMIKNNDIPEHTKILETWEKELEFDGVGFFQIHRFCKENKLTVPRTDKLIELLEKDGYKTYKTHFDPLGLKVNVSESDLVKIIKKI